MFKNEFCVWQQEISKTICDALLQEIDWAKAETASTFEASNDNYVEKKELRVSDIVWQDQYSVAGAIAQSYIGLANSNAEWNFLLNGLEKIQIARYGVEGHYDWHRDNAIRQTENVRKLSISILLNDPAEFEGGQLEIKDSNGDTLNNLLKNQGDIIVFPSYLEHRVSPVVLGTRYSAVTWATGPQFR
jgi:PKHD-type hydroxylase